MLAVLQCNLTMITARQTSKQNTLSCIKKLCNYRKFHINQQEHKDFVIMRILLQVTR